MTLRDMALRIGVPYGTFYRWHAQGSVPRPATYHPGRLRPHYVEADVERVMDAIRQWGYHPLKGRAATAR
jgi:predicted site-specific integrase-resolvase